VKRGTTSVWRRLTAVSLMPPRRRRRCIGRTRPPLLHLQEGRSGRYFPQRLLPPCTLRRLSERRNSLRTCSHRCVV